MRRFVIQGAVKSSNEAFREMSNYEFKSFHSDPFVELNPRIRVLNGAYSVNVPIVLGTLSVLLFIVH